MLVEEVRKQFPILDEKVYGRQLVYLDNAATSQRPLSVVDKWNDLTLKSNANIHRAVHALASAATDEFETTRDVVKEFINARFREEIIFTSGTTNSLNLLAFSFGEAFIGEGDEILILQSEHHSDIVPWQMMCQRKGAEVKMIPVDASGHIDLDNLARIVNSKTRLACIAHISNVLGLKNPVKDIVNICHSKGCMVSLDGAQGVAHSVVDVQDLDCDFYSFSGHKMFAAPGTGVLYGKRELLEKMPPYMGGGEMIESVSFEKTTYAPLPEKFEAGTQNIAGIPTLKPAIELIRELRCEEIEAEQKRIVEYMLDAIASDPRITLFGVPATPDEKIALFSFSVEGVHHEDLALILDKMGVAVRSGQMCAEPIMDRFGVTGMLRASFAQYNTLDEAVTFMTSLNKAIDMLI
ncbi:MAG: SufS family cysteine desulfurase [Bacteroidales bacterium]|nr:SufS family cysteine desulfurase [Bacteroidales bacterium]